MNIIKIISTLAFVFLFAGCNMMFNSENNFSGNENNFSVVRINVRGNGRTILPSSDNLKKIIVNAEPAEGNSNSALEPYEVNRNEDGSNFLCNINLPFGKWNISVIAYIVVNNIDYPAAKGSILFTAAAMYHDIIIPVIAPAAEGQGKFDYNIVFPDGGSVSVKLDTFPVGASPVYENNAVSGGEFNSVSVKSGVYFLTLKGAANGKTVTRNEIVHIYRESVTLAQYNLIFDLSEIIKVSGNVSIIKNGKPAQQAYINMYRTDNNDWLGNSQVDFDNNGCWEIILPVFDKQTNVYFRIEYTDAEGNYYDDIDTGTAAILYNEDVSVAKINL